MEATELIQILKNQTSQTQIFGLNRNNCHERLGKRAGQLCQAIGGNPSRQPRRALTEYVQGSADLASAQAPTAQAPAEQATAQASPFNIESAQAYATYMLKLIEAQI